MKTVGVGTRTINFLIDNFIILILSWLLSQWYDFHVSFANYTPLPVYSFFVITLIVYYFLFESILKRTPGKYLTITKVVTKNYGKPNILQIFIRTIIRLIPIDCFFIPFLNDRTLHDYLSKTYVVEI